MRMWAISTGNDDEGNPTYQSLSRPDRQTTDNSDTRLYTNAAAAQRAALKAGGWVVEVDIEDEVAIHWHKTEGRAWCGAPIERCGEHVTSTTEREMVTCRACIRNFDLSDPEKWADEGGGNESRVLYGAAKMAAEAKAAKPTKVHWRKGDTNYAWCGTPAGRCGTGGGRGKKSITTERSQCTCEQCKANYDRAIDRVRSKAKVKTEGLTAESLNLFLAYVRDAGNWSGTPPVGGNVGGTKEQRGNLTHLKKAGLIKTFTSDGDTWVQFTDAGRELASRHNIKL